MEKVLSELNSAVGVKGSAVVTKDGILVKSALDPGLKEEVVSALSSFLITTTGRALKDCGIDAFERFIITSTHGKVILVNLAEAYLVVVADQFINIDLTLVEIMSTARKLKKMIRIEV